MLDKQDQTAPCSAHGLQPTVQGPSSVRLAPTRYTLRSTRFPALATLPALMQAVQTLRMAMPPFSIILIFWRLGKKRRRVIPVVCRPIPPLDFGIPRRVIILPVRKPLPQISQTRAIMNSLSMPVNTWFVFSSRHPM